jgi:hypothetical protein
MAVHNAVGPHSDWNEFGAILLREIKFGTVVVSPTGYERVNLVWMPFSESEKLGRREGKWISRLDYGI